MPLDKALASVAARPVLFPFSCSKLRTLCEMMQARFAVFYGKVDKRPPGWYWTSVPEVGEHFKGPITGPFETKADAIERAIRSGAGRLH
jgi:hypothetical protein